MHPIVDQYFPTRDKCKKNLTVKTSVYG